jgi:hypothetical protein
LLRRFAFVLGLLFCLAALAVLGWDLWRLLAGEGLVLSALGRVWFELAPTSLQMLQPAIERHMAPWLWQNLIFPLLQWPAAAVFAALGLPLLWLGRARRPRRVFY